MNVIISIKDLLNTDTVALRDSTAVLEEELAKTTKNLIDFDFSGIRFVSRAFAHSLITLQDQLKPNVSINFINTLESVDSMLKTVREHLGQKYTDRIRESLLPLNGKISSTAKEFFDS